MNDEAPFGRGHVVVYTTVLFQQLSDDRLQLYSTWRASVKNRYQSFGVQNLISG
jgi:hypothetical protein